MTSQQTKRMTIPIRFAEEGGVINVRFAGRSFDVSLPGLDVEPGSNDEQVKRAVAEYLDVPSYRLDDYVIDRHPGGNLTLRPEATLRYKR